MKKCITSVILLLLLVAAYGQPASASEYKFIKKLGATSLYERWIKHTGAGEVRELKAVFIVNATSEEVIGLLKNQTAGTQWNNRASSYKVAATAQPHQWVNYIRYDMPVMMDDQDCCLLFTRKDMGKGIQEITFQSTTCAQFPVQEKVKRVAGVKGKWLLEPVDQQHLKVTYIISSDRNTSIPRMISDPIIRDNLFQTMSSFKALVEK